MKKRDSLTDLVIQYKKTNRRFKKNILFKEIMKKSEKLVYMVAKYYYMQYFPKVIQDDIVNTSKSIILLRAIEGFKVSKKTKFGTYYVWKLKSFIRYKQKLYLRRKKVVEAYHLDNVVVNNGDDRQLTLKDMVGNKSCLRYKEKVSKKIQNIFGI